MVLTVAKPPPDNKKKDLKEEAWHLATLDLFFNSGQEKKHCCCTCLQQQCKAEGALYLACLALTSLSVAMIRCSIEAFGLFQYTQVISLPGGLCRETDLEDKNKYIRALIFVCEKRCQTILFGAYINLCLM